MELLGIDLATAFRIGDRGTQALLGGKTDLNLDGATAVAWMAISCKMYRA